MKRRILLLTTFIVLCCASARAQEPDTTGIAGVRTLESRLDSLRATIRFLDNELQIMRQRMVEGRSDVDDLVALLNDEEPETAPEDRRSRRKRVDALLKAIEQRPGQLRINGGATASFQGSLSDEYGGSTGVASFDIYAHTTFGPRTVLFLDLEAIGGDGPDALHPTFGGLNGDAGSTQDSDGVDRMTVLEAWAEFTILKELVTVTAGKIDLTNYFDNNASANDETMQFLSGAFVNSAALVVPGNSPGARVRTAILRRFFLQLGVASADNSGGDLFRDLYTIGSCGFGIFPDSDWETNMRVYSFRHPAAPGAYGFGLSFDAALFRAYNVFARYGLNEDGVADWYGVASAWSAGTRFVRRFGGRTTVFGLAYGETEPRSDVLRVERVFELYARHQINKWVHVSPHLQMVWNCAGSSDHIALVGARVHFNF